MDKSFLPGSLLDNVDKFANSLGYENAAIAMHLATIPWDDVADRNNFIESITGRPVQGGDTRSFISGVTGRQHG